jgi:hypothetical protein
MLQSSGCVTQQWHCYWFRKMVRYLLRIMMFIILTSMCTLYLQLRLPVLRHTAAITLLTPATTLPCDQKNGEISTCGGETYYSDAMYLQLRHPALRHVAVVALPTPANVILLATRPLFHLHLHFLLDSSSPCARMVRLSDCLLEQHLTYSWTQR